jgi:hypothetical protein
MTIVSADFRKKIAVAKIDKLMEQLNALLVEDFPFSDAKKALNNLNIKAKKNRVNAGELENFSENLQKQFTLSVSYLLSSSSEIMGIVSRSGTMRNAFEFYQPFKDLCQKFFDEEIYLILSSEWNYIPFTYPMNLEDLPDFIIIGLPATESNSILIFPSAAHELGHSIWLKDKIKDQYNEQIYDATLQFINENENIFTELIPANMKDNAETDLFARQIKEQFHIEATNSCLRQLEELFCDFVALVLFGRSYLYAFQYLVAPGEGRYRSMDYPDTKSRALILKTFAQSLGIEIPNYENEFSHDRSHQTNSYDAAVIKVADAVRTKFHQLIYNKAIATINKINIQKPNDELIEKIGKYFEQGMPFGDQASLGEIMCAAWDYFLKTEIEGNGTNTQLTVNAISDLVLKTVEAQQFKEKILDAK